MTTWRKSSYSGSQANCVEVGTALRKSTYSGSQASCIEVGMTRPGGVLIRDTKERGHGNELTVSVSDWRRFLVAVRGDRAVK